MIPDNNLTVKLLHLPHQVWVCSIPLYLIGSQKYQVNSFTARTNTSMSFKNCLVILLDYWPMVIIGPVGGCLPRPHPGHSEGPSAPQSLVAGGVSLQGLVLFDFTFVLVSLGLR